MPSGEFGGSTSHTNGDLPPGARASRSYAAGQGPAGRTRRTRAPQRGADSRHALRSGCRAVDGHPRPGLAPPARPGDLRAGMAPDALGAGGSTARGQAVRKQPGARTTCSTKGADVNPALDRAAYEVRDRSAIARLSPRDPLFGSRVTQSFLFHPCLLRQLEAERRAAAWLAAHIDAAAVQVENALYDRQAKPGTC
jgi:hypothetical protein